MEFTPQNYKVSTLVTRIEEGEIALPEFQRDFLWQPPAIADLLRTVARQWPAGTFLVLEVEDQPAFAFKALKGAPPATHPKILILDGQQRTTALFHALTDIAGETYFVDMGAVAATGELKMTTFDSLRRLASLGTIPTSRRWQRPRSSRWRPLLTTLLSTSGVDT